jgi:hypothetical protein
MAKLFVKLVGVSTSKKNSALSYIQKSIRYLFSVKRQGPNAEQDRQDLMYINLLKTERRPLYLKAQSVPRCKHFSFRL